MKKKENSSLMRPNITDGDHSRSEQRFTALDADKAAGKAETDLDVKAKRVHGYNYGPAQSTS